MARLDEVAEGICQVLRHAPTPEPVEVDLLNHSPVDAAMFVRFVAEICWRDALPLALVRISPELGIRLFRSLEEDEPLGPGKVPLELSGTLGSRVAFYRTRPS